MAQELVTNVQKNLTDAVGTLWRKNMTDLVRGIRSNKDSEAKYISSAMQEIKEELASQDKDEKANAVQKLTYLQMYGYDMGWGAFRMIEVIAQPKFSHKRIGYLAASQCFNENTDVMVLATNLIRKDCLSHQMYDAGIAINCLANICTPELARDLVPDIVSMVTSARPYTRKKAVLVLYKIFLKFPDALRPTFARLREKLEDADPSVVCAAVNVICELARKNAKNHLPLAPQLYKLLTSSTNNWMLIKIIKLFAVLCPLEERLAKKLAEPLSNIINTTNAMSLLYEAIQCCISGLNQFPNIMRLCASKLRMFVEHPDPNLKYLGLLALSKIMVSFPKGIIEHRDLILSCLEDEDTTIRSRALDLVVGMVEKKNIAFIIDKLKQFMEQAEGAYRSELLEKIVYICSLEKYKNIPDFEWYLSVLMDLSQYKNCTNYSILRDQFIDVCVRVQVVRAYGVKSMLVLLQDPVLFAEDTSKGGMNETLYAAAYITGEYAELCEEKEKAIDLLTKPIVMQLPSHIQAIFLQAALKVLVALGQQSVKDGAALSDAFSASSALFKERIAPFMSSADLEVQDRSCLIAQILEVASEQADKGVELIKELSAVLGDALNPVSAQAQSRVKPPEGLDLDKWIHEPLKAAKDIEAIAQDEGWGGIGSGGYGSSSGGSGKSSGFGDSSWQPTRQLDEEEIRRRAATHRAERAARGDVYFITEDPDELDVPVRELSQDVPVGDIGGDIVDRGGRGRGRGRGRGGRGRGGAGMMPRQSQPVQLIDEVNPDGWTGDDSAADSKKPKDALSSISFDEGEDDGSNLLQHKQHRNASTPTPKADSSELKLSSSPSISKPSPTASPAASRGAPAPRARGAAPRGRGQPRGRGGASSAPVKAPPRRPRFLFSNDALSAQYDVVLSKEKKDEATLIVALVNKAAAPMANVAVTFSALSSASVGVISKGARTESSTVELAGIAIPPSSSPQLVKQLLVISGPVTSASTVKGVVSFKLDGFESESSADFSVDLPPSLFIQPVHPPLDPAAFFNLLRTKATETRTGRLTGALGKALEVICGFYNVRVIERDDVKGSAYGVSVQGHHVAFLIKQDGGPTSLAVAVKSNSADLGAALIAELEKVKEILAE